MGGGEVHAQTDVHTAYSTECRTVATCLPDPDNPTATLSPDISTALGKEKQQRQSIMAAPTGASLLIDSGDEEKRVGLRRARVDSIGHSNDGPAPGSGKGDRGDVIPPGVDPRFTGSEGVRRGLSQRRELSPVSGGFLFLFIFCAG